MKFSDVRWVRVVIGLLALWLGFMAGTIAQAASCRWVFIGGKWLYLCF